MSAAGASKCACMREHGLKIFINSVRARAIVCFGQCLVSKDEVIAGTVREIMTPQLTGRQGQQPRLVKTPGPLNSAGKKPIYSLSTDDF